MYLMSLANADYVVITLLFAAIFCIAYLFRRKNQTAALFVYADAENAKPYIPNQSLISYGVIELTLCGAVGAIYGLSGMYYIILAWALSCFLSAFIIKTIYPDSLFNYIGNILGSKVQAIFAIFSVIVLLFLAVATTVFTFKLFQSLLGWNFINSTFGITMVALIYVLIGGSWAVKSNARLCASVVLSGFLIVIIVGIINLGGLSAIMANLHDLAIKKGMAYNYYTGFQFNFILFCQVLIAGLFLTMVPFLAETKSNRRMDKNALVKIIPMSLMIMGGILAIATPIAKNAGGSETVTMRVQLPDGQTGYVIKAIDNAKTKPSDVSPGIIPPILNPETNLIEPNMYNYMLANPITLKHYLPKALSVILVLVILSAFIFALSGYLLGISKLVVFDISGKLGWLSSYGEIGEIWLTRMSIICASSISLFGGYFLVPYLDLTKVAYILGGFAGVFCLFILYIVTYYGQAQKK